MILLVVAVAGFAGGVIWARKPANVAKMYQYQQKTKTKLATLNQQYVSISSQGKSVTLKAPIGDKLKMKMYPKLIDPIPSMMRPIIDRFKLEGHVYGFAAGNIGMTIVGFLSPVVLIICFYTTAMFIYATEYMHSRNTPLLRKIYPFAQEKVNNLIQTIQKRLEGPLDRDFSLESLNNCIKFRFPSRIGRRYIFSCLLILTKGIGRI